MSSNPFSSAFLAQLKQKEKAASQPPPAPAPAPAHEPAPPPAEGVTVQEVKDDQGRLLQRIPFKDGKIEGVMEVFNPETEKPTHRLPYVKGVLEGTVIMYDAAQKPTQEIPYVAGQKKGLCRFYHQGMITSEITYDQDKMNGIATFYGPNTMVHAIAHYKDGHLEGPFQSFDGKKNLIRECAYKAGLLEGPCKTFYPSGKLFEEAIYKNNKVQGAQNQYLEDGALLRRVTYNDEGKPFKEETFSAKGEKLSEKKIDHAP